jgi:hypothetical protein
MRFAITKYDGHPRTLAIPHPKPHSELVKFLSSDLITVQKLVIGANSRIKPGIHPDGRLFEMHYPQNSYGHLDKDYLQIPLGSTHYAKFDIENCFGSIYTHSFDWVEDGVDLGKISAKGKQRKSNF